MELTTSTFATSEADYRRERLASEVRHRALIRRVLARRRQRAAQVASITRRLPAA